MANQGFLSVFVVGMSFITQFVKNIKNTITHQTPKPEKKPTQTPQPEEKPTLNPDTLLETLFRTCVKSLLKFQAVSKSRFSLINHPLFIRWHLKFNFSRNCELICNCISYHRRQNIIALLRANGPPVSVLKVDKFGPSLVHCPVRINFRDFSRNMVICGSINGIVVCMSHLGGFEKKCLGLWNPAVEASCSSAYQELVPNVGGLGL
ncbi:hypothetical protein POM88_024151 [Heracleum sosnowskyi]|uniref:Uncharacterized protein n=1 Tax=Heracleum sosnowskyi TaxID=360622 RepID=A0AAD8I1G1_9APIA|nr:hypothetical protein POM88_024151 [Heracleum sosnowskyi]